MITRILAVLAAMLLVAAFALGTIAPPRLSLGEGLALLDDQVLVGLQNFFAMHLPRWVWYDVMVPLIVRPVWLIPAALGVILGGAAATVTGRHPRQSRRRS